jgi:8-oxo-dGTP diphosphatase
LEVKKTHHVVGAAIVRDGKVLCAKRGDKTKSLAGYWEFPGGKIEPGETAEAALIREMREECLCDIKVIEEIATTRHEYDFAVIVLTTFFCALEENSDEPRLTEHAELTWTAPAKMKSLLWAPADCEAVDVIVQRLG